MSMRLGRRLKFENLESRIALSANGLFNCVDPLASPADGNVLLYIDDFGVNGGPADNTFVAKLTGITIQAGKTYTIVGAAGNANDQPLGDQSLQAFSTPDGTVGNRNFIGQNFSDSGHWNSPSPGEWVDNSFEFQADSFSALIGEQIIILVSNYGGGDPGAIYWDNFRVLEDGNQVFFDSLEVSLAPGSEGDVTDAGWDLGNSTVANSGLLYPNSEAPPTNDFGVTVTANAVEITNPKQRLSFVKDFQGQYRLSTFVWDNGHWQSLFDAQQPILRGPTFDLNPTSVNVLTNTATDLAVELSGTHPTQGHPFTLLVEGTNDSNLLHFRFTLDLQSPLTISGPEPSAMLWMNRPGVDVQVNQGPSNIYTGTDDVNWGNSFPAAYLWDEGVEAAVFFDMSDMQWMGQSNLRRFKDVRVQSYSAGGQTGIGLRAISNGGSTIPAGEMVVDFYLHAAARPDQPTRLEGLDTMVDSFAPLHPSTAAFPSNRLAPYSTDWTTFAAGVDSNLQLKGIVWDDVTNLENRNFIAQNFSDSGSWNTAPTGGWTNNSISFNSNNFPERVGEELLILISNYDGGDPGRVYWDNFRVIESGSQVFVDSLETGLAPGTEGEVTDAGWNLGSASLANSGLLVPNSPGNLFNLVTPLAAPASQNTLVYLDDDAFMLRSTGITIRAGTTYTITAATGRANGSLPGDQSIQAWSASALWQDGPLFEENIIDALHVSTDTAVGSSLDPFHNRDSVLEAWDFSTVNNYLAPWIAYDRLHQDSSRHDFVVEKANALPMFFDPIAGIMRHGTRMPAHVGPFEMSWQNFMFHLETLNSSRMLAPDDFNPAIAGKFLMAMDGLIEYAHNTNYNFPQWFDPVAKLPSSQQDVPALGIVNEPWQIGTFTYLMTQAYELTGDATYLNEATVALDSFFTSLSYTISNSVYTTTYDDVVDFPVTEIFGNAWGIAAATSLHQLTGNAKYELYADNFLNSLVRMTYWYESDLLSDSKDLELRTAGLFRNHAGVTTGSPWENSEATLPLTVLLKHESQPNELVLKILNLQRINSFSFYPAVQSDNALAYPTLLNHAADYLPIEDYYTFEFGGQNGVSGRRIYMTGGALWNYLLYEAYAKSDDQEILIVSLDVIEGVEKAISSTEREFIAYNPMEVSKTFGLQMDHLAAGEYILSFEDSLGVVTQQPYSASTLASGISMSLASGESMRVKLKHIDASALNLSIDAGQNARNSISHAYQLLQDEAIKQGISPSLLQLKQTYKDALLDYDNLSYDSAKQQANEIIAALVQPQNADFDTDGDVDGRDFLQWQRGFGAVSGANVSDGDANNDAAVNGLDLILWQEAYGSQSAPLNVQIEPRHQMSNDITSPILIFSDTKSMFGITTGVNVAQRLYVNKIPVEETKDFSQSNPLSVGVLDYVFSIPVRDWTSYTGEGLESQSTYSSAPHNDKESNTSFDAVFSGLGKNAIAPFE
ncbi:hypothetical protein [Bythopirellula polymerisocia]|uniref:Uncharacterized protein n=1 Tax=Bythopirellula polymerisocia TaxID=2528003 RepID=A0A5C6CF15_9BACT|nr:hypothetical protein [Bythopirellula polymerisocia]TWU21399.1 hypothetical protein Pla144_46200 [Bythopirellula polymerisocia]